MRKLLSKNKKGFSTASAIIGGVIGIAFLIVFAFIFLTQLSSDSITGTGTYADNQTDRLIANFSSGVTSVNNAIPTVLSLAVFVLIIAVLLIAYVFARRNGLGGGGELG